MNCATLTGFIGADPEVITTPTGTLASTWIEPSGCDSEGMLYWRAGLGRVGIGGWVADPQARYREVQRIVGEVRAKTAEQGEMN